MSRILQIKENLSQLIQQESQLNDELDLLLSSKLGVSIDRLLKDAKPVLEQQQRNADGLRNIIEKTFTIAQQMSSRVSKLDQEQARVRSTLKLLDQIKDCKQCAMGVKRALKDNQLTQACDFIKRYLQTDVETIEKIYNSISIQIDDDEGFGTSPIEELKHSQLKVVQVLMEGFDDAIEAQDTEKMVQFFKMFPIVGASEVGMDKYSAYICRQLSDNMNKVLQSKTNPIVFVECMGMLFESIASTIDKQEGMLETVYGVAAVLSLIVRLQREADVQGCLLVGSWLDARQVERQVKMIEKQKSIDSIDVEPRDLDVILGELAVITNKAGLFDRFMRTRATAELDSIKENNLHPLPKSKVIDMTKLQVLPTVTKLNEKMQSCITYFLVLADFFIQKSIKKALLIDGPMEDSKTTSCVDDVFFILKSSIQRGLSTGDPDCLCVLINSISKSFEVDYMSKLQHQLSSLFQGKEEVQLKQITPTLNNIDMSIVYMQRLCEEVEREIEFAFGHCSLLSHEQIKACLSVCNDFASKCDTVLKTWLENYFKQTMKPKVRHIISMLCMDSKYMLNEEEYSSLEAGDVFGTKLQTQFQRLVDPFKENMTDRNWNRLVGMAIESFAKEWETKLLQFRFNALGALKLDKEIRNAIGLLNKYTTSTRELFQRLSQIGLILSLEEINDVQEYWGSKSGSIRWRLNVAEVKKVMGLRFDFQPLQIAQLEL